MHFVFVSLEPAILPSQTLPGDGVEDQHNAAIHHVPFIPFQVVYKIRDEVELLYAEALKHATMPGTAAAENGSHSVYNAERHNALDRSRYNAKGQSVRVVLVPGLDIERHECCVLVSS